MNVYAIARPDAEARAVALSVYREILDAHAGRSRPSLPRRCSTGWR
jgi:hypothetical protein